MDKRMIEEATQYLKGLKRVKSVEEGMQYSEDVLLLPDNIDVVVDDNCNIRTIGFDKSKDIKAKDLLRVIEVKDAKSMQYRETNVLAPSVYVHSLQEKPWHITTQGFLVTRISEKTKEFIMEEKQRLKNYYGKHELDCFWLPCSKLLSDVKNEELVCIFNRRISGWDGSIDRPVVELLGAGGHLQTIWDDKNKCFRCRSFESNLMKEFDEEIGLEIKDEDIRCIGGFVNDKTQELVIFSCIFIDETDIPGIQKYALNNLAEDTDGIYLGTFLETMHYYRKNPEYFAGGVKAAKTNFPNNDYIIGKICELYSVDSIE